MSETPPSGPSGAPQPAGRRTSAEEAERRRRLARMFGEVLPESTRDESAEAWGERERPDAGDEWWRSQVPPHHGG